MKLNDKGLIYLDSDRMNAIFDCVYGINGGQNSSTKKLLKDRQFNDFVKLLNNLQEYNYQYRSLQAIELSDIFEASVGPMQNNSDGPIIWCSLGLAIKELYGMRRETLKSLLKLVTIRK
ncbi:hypothetical protein RCG17_01225 [Neobacillus sp. PS3-12]|jgi:hypothetical protein|uniref:hypothetical protein n=1 Tax=Neobacillus sp. PS3-12 TaxID=3070677 RepID=UPI0027E10823|nr:hypothetical protein [Neobacillus sp. PS3-12]WML53359.1 hypothetical protein RCG17_01225 [Neobacillus sp. PS3-12]